MTWETCNMTCLYDMSAYGAATIGRLLKIVINCIYLGWVNLFSAREHVCLLQSMVIHPLMFVKTKENVCPTYLAQRVASVQGRASHGHENAVVMYMYDFFHICTYEWVRDAMNEFAIQCLEYSEYLKVRTAHFQGRVPLGHDHKTF